MIGSSASKDKRFKIRGQQHSGRTKSFGIFRSLGVEQSGDKVEGSFLKLQMMQCLETRICKQEPTGVRTTN